jgi:hypothetical protein
MSNKMRSLLLYLIIQFQRGGDHVWRTLSGLPLSRRSVITPNVYLGGQYGLRRIGRMKKLGVTGVVNMRMHSIHKDGDVHGLHILNLPTPDRTAPSLDQLQEGVAFIQKEIDAGGKVYIHCHWGEGRGPTMAIAYLIATGMTYKDAYSLVKQVRTFISPTVEQIHRLKEFGGLLNSKSEYRNSKQ